MKSFFSDLFYAIKNENGKAKAFYIMAFITMILTFIGFVSGIVGEVVYITADNFQALPAVISGVCLCLCVGVFVWLNKLRKI